LKSTCNDPANPYPQLAESAPFTLRDLQGERCGC
jgi:hypothetical protein